MDLSCLLCIFLSDLIGSIIRGWAVKILEPFLLDWVLFGTASLKRVASLRGESNWTLHKCWRNEFHLEVANEPSWDGLGLARLKNRQGRIVVGPLMNAAFSANKWARSRRPMGNPLLTLFKMEQTCSKKLCIIIIVMYKALVISLTIVACKLAWQVVEKVMSH